MKSTLLFIILLLTTLSSYYSSAQIITTFAGICDSPGYTGDLYAATNAKLRFPKGIVVDNAGNIYFTEVANNIVRKVNSSGIISTYAGNGISGFSGDGGAATNAQLNSPGGLAIDKYDNIYIADVTNKRIRKVDASGTIISFAGNGSSTVSGDGGLAIAAGLGTTAKGICFDTSGNLYIGGSYYIRKVNTLGVISTIAGTGINGYSGDGGLADTAKIGSVGSFGIDVNNNIYFSNDFRVRKINSVGIINCIAGNVTGGYSGDNGPATAAYFNSLHDTFVDSCGNIYVADGGNGAIRIINAAGNVYTIAGNGTSGYSGDGGPATAAKLQNPHYMYLDKKNNLYIADLDNHCVRKVTLPRCDSLKLWASEMMGTTEKIEAYPNPNNGEFTLKVSAHTMQPINVSVITMVGTVIDEYTVRAGKEIPIRHSLPQGLYFLVAATENGRMMSKMVVR